HPVQPVAAERLGHKLAVLFPAHDLIKPRDPIIDHQRGVNACSGTHNRFTNSLNTWASEIHFRDLSEHVLRAWIGLFLAEQFEYERGQMFHAAYAGPDSLRRHHFP